MGGTRMRRVGLPSFALAAVVAAGLAGAGISGASPHQAVKAVPPGTNSDVQSVTVAPGSTDAWGIFTTQNVENGNERVTVLHRHNNKWFRTGMKGLPTTGKDPHRFVRYEGIAAGSAKQIWVAGTLYTREQNNSNYASHPLLGRSSGGAFHAMTISGFYPGGQYLAVAASSATNAWLVGTNSDESADEIFHWNGHTWTSTPLAIAPAFGGAVLSTNGPDNAWLLVPGATIEHWNGASWSEVTLPAPGGYLDAIAARGGESALVAGYQQSSQTTTHTAGTVPRGTR